MKYGIYLRDGQIISDIMEVSEADNIGLVGIQVIRSHNIDGLKRLVNKMGYGRKNKLTRDVINDLKYFVERWKENDNLEAARDIIKKYTGQDICCLGGIKKYVDSLV